MKINNKKLLKIKEELGLNYRDFAIHISNKVGENISVYALWSVCTLNHNATLKTISKISKFLNIPISELLDEESRQEYELIEW